MEEEPSTKGCESFVGGSTDLKKSRKKQKMKINE